MTLVAGILDPGTVLFTFRRLTRTLELRLSSVAFPVPDKDGSK